MGKKICLSVIALVCIFLLAGCTNAKESGASNLFSFNDKEVEVAVDLSDGWYVDFGENATYLFDQKPNNDTEAAAYGVYVSKEEYDEDIDEYKKAKGYKEIEDGIYFEEENLSKYIIKIDEDIYFEVIVHDNDNYTADEVFERFSVKLSEY